MEWFSASLKVSYVPNKDHFDDKQSIFDFKSLNMIGILYVLNFIFAPAFGF